jgi:hypothetical protein
VVLSITPPPHVLAFWKRSAIAVSSNRYLQFHGVIRVPAYRSCGSVSRGYAVSKQNDVQTGTTPYEFRAERDG